MTETAIRPEAITASLTGLDLVVSPLLPMTPSPAEDARRIVRHGYGAELLAWCHAGDVGPKPGEPTRALQVGRMLLVDAELAQQIDDEHRLEGRRTRDRETREARQRAHIRRELEAIAHLLRVAKVVAYRVDHKLEETLYRIPKGGDLAGDWVAEVWIRDEDLRRAGTDAGRRLLVANRLREALVEAKLDDEEAGRGR